MKSLRILILAHEDLIPPKNATPKRAANAAWKTEYDVWQSLRNLGHKVHFVGVYSNLDVIRRALFEHKPHIVFNLLEEFNGFATYDHNVVSYLELRQYAYTGCNPRGLMLARDKALSKKILSFHKIPTPKFAIIEKGQQIRAPKNLSFPIFVKSLVEEASLGISQASIVKNLKQLKTRVRFIHEKIGTDALLEQYIDGREFYVGVWGNKKVQTLEAYELKFRKLKNGSQPIATRNAKWSEVYRKRHGISSSPADLNPKLYRKLHTTARKCYQRLGLSGYARIDLRVDKSGHVFVLEANPNPGIARDEDFTRGAASKGISYEKMISKILNLAQSWFENRS